MKWKTLLLLSLALLFIVGAFAAPPILLRRSVSHSMEQAYFAEAPALELRAAENTVEKLASFSDSEASFFPLRTEEDVQQLASLLHGELDKLCRTNAIPQRVCDSLDAAVYDGFEAERFCMVQPKQHLMFELLSIHLWSVNAQLVLDWSSGKLLGIGYALLDDELLALECDEAQAIRELQGWADYLELRPGQVLRTDLRPEELPLLQPYGQGAPLTLKQIILSDDAGASVPFCQSVTGRTEVELRYTWGSVF